MKILHGALLLLILSISYAGAQPKLTKLDKLFAELAAKGTFNGTVLVANQDEVLYRSNIGMSDFENQNPINNETVFELASMGKQFTAMAIMILHERSMINYDSPARAYVKDLPYENVTVRHLLTMTSGISDYLNFADQIDKDQIVTNRDVVDFFALSTPSLGFTPGARFEYSNTNYVLLATIVEQVVGIPFCQFLKESIFDPLEMNSTRSYTTRFSENEAITNYAYPYILSGTDPIRTDRAESTQYVINASSIEGDGSVVSTVDDLLRWTRGLQDNKLVTRETLDEAYSPYLLDDGTTSDYGFGMYLGKNKVWHWGGWPGVQTSYTRYLDKGIVAIYLKNVESNDWSWIGKFEKLVQR